MIKLSFTTMATPSQSGIEAIKMASRYGYDGVDMRISGNMGELNLHSTDYEINEIKKAYDDEGIQCSGLLCYTDKEWDKMKESIKANMEIARKLNAPSIRIHPGKKEECSNTYEFVARNADIISKIIAEENPEFDLLLQNHKNNISCKEIIDIIRKVNHPRIGLIFSPDHCYITNEDASMYPAIKSVTRQIYVADIKKVGEKHKSVLPGRGEVPIKDSFQAIGGNEFMGWVTFKWEKIWQTDIEEPEIALPYFIEYMKKICG